ncbi:flavin reductase family protein [Rhodococcus qingshengii]|jgi:flavin reductase (DIM6/NTAB) family NADH-FMN oxidoreductase RutF|uniref:Flavin reductase n=2 Tax=Actinomycetes TaxID=1760 RepID=A0A2A5IX19_RHOSG|nr:flavin reductase family protein [Rhodococcus qingshengii]PCK21803.1 flavin reductase [Rhodococcus qingshengii]|tara:strand:- start:774 stop:1376 length:603 start_codon:yes stop_codon:yes gene_type:complete
MSEQERTCFSSAELGSAAYGMLTRLVVPRPIAWISSVSVEGVGNLAPHSFFTVVSTDPPMIAFTSEGIKDTLRNVSETGEFVVNIATSGLRESVNATSASYERGVDEAAEVGVVMEPSDVVNVPRVAHSPASLECRLHSTIPLGNSVVVVGEVVAFSVSSDALVAGRPDIAKLQPVSRLGGDEWGLPPEVTHLKRPGRPS